MPPKAQDTDKSHDHDDDDVNTVFFLNHGSETDTSGMWGKAIVAELRNTVGTWWWKEMTNLNQKTIAVSFFVFFAAVAPAIVSIKGSVDVSKLARNKPTNNSHTIPTCLADRHSVRSTVKTPTIR